MDRSMLTRGMACALVILAGSVASYGSVQSDESLPPPVDHTSPASGGGPETAPAQDLLSGPAVTQKGEESRETMGGNTPDRPERGQQREMNPLQWVELIMSLDLDAAQRRAFEERIRTIRAQHEAYRRTSGREIQRLRRQVSGAESNSVAEGVALQRRIQLLQQGAPNFQGVQEELWSMLTPEQQKEMRSRIENSRGRLQRDRGPMRGDDTSMSEMGMTITDGAQIASEDLARYRARLAFLKRLRDRAAMD